MVTMVAPCKIDRIILGIFVPGLILFWCGQQKRRYKWRSSGALEKILRGKEYFSLKLNTSKGKRIVFKRSVSSKIIAEIVTPTQCALQSYDISKTIPEL